MNTKKLSLLILSIIILVGESSELCARGGGGGRGGGRGGGGRGGGHAARAGGGRGARAGGGRAAGRGAAGRGAGRRGDVGRGGRGYGRGAYGGGGWGRGWGNAWGWGLFGGALLWTAPLWWNAGTYADYSNQENYVYVIPDASTDEKIQIPAWAITNNTPEPIQITSGKFEIEVAPGESQDVPQTKNTTFNVMSQYNDQQNTFTSKDLNVDINDVNGHTVMKNASMSKKETVKKGLSNEK